MALLRLTTMLSAAFHAAAASAALAVVVVFVILVIESQIAIWRQHTHTRLVFVRLFAYP